jgi:hypothetical protein
MEEPQDLATFIEESHRALDEFLCGDPTPLQALFSQRDDVTLANPFGPSQRGWPQVRDTMARAGVNYRDGRALGFDRLSEHFTPELACIHELERLEAKVGGADERTAFLLRCTSVFPRCIPVGHLDIAAWRCEHLDHVQVYAIIDGLSRPEHPLGAAVEVFIRREDAERFIDEVRGDEPELASCLRSSSASSRPAGGFRKELVSRLTNRNLRNRLPRPLLDRDPVTSRPSTSPARSSCRTTNPTATATRASRCGSR